MLLYSQGSGVVWHGTNDGMAARVTATAVSPYVGDNGLCMITGQVGRFGSGFGQREKREGEKEAGFRPSSGFFPVLVIFIFSREKRKEEKE